MSRTVRASGDDGGTAPKSAGNSGKRLNHTIECLLNLRSVRDQFKDAELDLSHDKVAEQLEDLEDRLVDHLAEERELRDGVGLVTVAVVGDFNSGKSTFINALLGTKLCPVGDEPTTASVTHFIHGDKQRFEIERNGTRTSMGKREYLQTVCHSKVGDREAYVFHVSLNSALLEHVRLVDTPGFNAPPPNSNDTKVTEDAVATADALFVIMDARKGNPSKTLLEQLDRLRNTRRSESGAPAFLLLNKAELLPPSQRNETRRHSEKQSQGRFRNVSLVSALRLNDSDDAVTLDALETTTRRIRAALSRQESFEARISAKVVTERGQANYRIDIDGNASEASVSSDGDLASSEQLAEMVRSVASERHALLERQFRRRTSQLRQDWLKVASRMDGLCKRAAMISSGAGDATDRSGHNALKTIGDAKDRILSIVQTIFREVVEEAVAKGPIPKPRFWPHYIEVRLDDACGVVESHDGWGKLKTIVDSLIDSLKRVTDVETVQDPAEIGARLRQCGVNIVRETIETDRDEFENDEHWQRTNQGKTWRRVYEDEETQRDDEYDRLQKSYESDMHRWTNVLSQHLQPVIDQLQETIIRRDERARGAVRERGEELTKLRDRIGELNEYTP